MKNSKLSADQQERHKNLMAGADMIVKMQVEAARQCVSMFGTKKPSQVTVLRRANSGEASFDVVKKTMPKKGTKVDASVRKESTTKVKRKKKATKSNISFQAMKSFVHQKLVLNQNPSVTQTAICNYCKQSAQYTQDKSKYYSAMANMNYMLCPSCFKDKCAIEAAFKHLSN